MACKMSCIEGAPAGGGTGRATPSAALGWNDSRLRRLWGWRRRRPAAPDCQQLVVAVPAAVAAAAAAAAAAAVAAACAGERCCGGPDRTATVA